jgi:TLC domain
VCCYHSVLAVVLPLIWLYFENDYTCGKKISDLELIILINTWGFHLFDMLFMQYHGTLDMGNFLHHFMGTIVYAFVFYQQHNFNAYAIHLILAEITTTSMHVRDILRAIGWRYTLTFYINDYYYGYGYILFRFFLMPLPYFFMYYGCRTSNPALLVLYPAHVLQSWFYVSKLPKMIRRRTQEMKKLRSAGLKIEWFNPIHSKKAEEAGVRGYEPFAM